MVAIPQTAPVPPDKDAGANYQLHPISNWSVHVPELPAEQARRPSSGNPNWTPNEDPEAKQLASKIIIKLNVNADDIDNRLMAGDIDIDAGGTGVQAAAQAEILSNPSLMKYSDDALSGFLWFAYINTKVAPLTNVACREAIEYAADKTDQQTAYGGPHAGGAIASTVLPPTIIGYQKTDPYDALTQPNGDLAAAKSELAACGQPNGFTVGLAYRSDRPREVQAAQSLQAALAPA